MRGRSLLPPGRRLPTSPRRPCVPSNSRRRPSPPVRAPRSIDLLLFFIIRRRTFLLFLLFLVIKFLFALPFYPPSLLSPRFSSLRPPPPPPPAVLPATSLLSRPATRQHRALLAVPSERTLNADADLELLDSLVGQL